MVITLRECFELWYRIHYWDWKHNSTPERELSFFNEEKDAYNHMDVDLAYQAFKAGYSITQGF